MLISDIVPPTPEYASDPHSDSSRSKVYLSPDYPNTAVSAMIQPFVSVLSLNQSARPTYAAHQYFASSTPPSSFNT